MKCDKHCFTPFFPYNVRHQEKIIILGGTGMYTSEFSKHWDDVNGYTMEEAMKKKEAVDEAHGVGTPTSKWNPAKIVPIPVARVATRLSSARRCKYRKKDLSFSLARGSFHLQKKKTDEFNDKEYVCFLEEHKKCTKCT